MSARSIYTVIMVSFWSDFADGFEKPFKFAYDQGSRVVGLGDKLLDAAGNAAQGLGNLLSGNSLIYIMIGVAAIVILPIVLKRVL